MVPAPGPSPALPASPQRSPAANAPTPLPSLIDDPLRGLPNPPDPGRFSPQVRAWASLRAAGLAHFGEIPDAEAMPGYLRQAGFGLLGDMGDGDIMALRFIVLMEAAKSAEEDLKAIMAKVKAINDAKQQSSGAGEGSLDDLQKLQSLTARRSKLLATLSNLLKKQSETEREVAASQK